MTSKPTIAAKYSAFRAQIEPELAKVRPLDVELYQHVKASKLKQYVGRKVDPKRRKRLT